MGDSEILSAEMSDAVEKFWELLRQEPGLNVRNDTGFALRHLRAADGDPQKAFTKMKTYYELKRDAPEWYAREAPEAYLNEFDLACDEILPNRDTSGRRIWISKLGKIDASRTTIHRMACMHDLILETILDEAETQKNGIIIIVDLKDFPWGLFRWISPTNSRMVTKKNDSLPFPRMEYHVVNASWIFSVLLKAVMPFMSKKQKEYLFKHDDLASLHEKVDPSCLPEEYGGQLPDVSGSTKQRYKLVFDHTDKLIVNLRLGYVKKNDLTDKIDQESSNLEID